jgi:DNA-binding HxlR family transcriptional regulator
MLVPMPRPRFEEVNCPIARTLDVVGDRWTPLVIRDMVAGLTRFDAIQRNLGISRKVLAERLATLTGSGVVERAAYQDNPPRYDYSLTEKGEDLALVLLAMKTWGDRWVFGNTDVPLLIRHDACGTVGDPVPTCTGCGEQVHARDVTPLPGPGFAPGPGTSLSAERIRSAVE